MRPLVVNLPDNFDARFLAACSRRGLPAGRCPCMLAVVKDKIADEHLELMLLYFEDSAALDNRLMQELEEDEARFNLLKEEIDEAVATFRQRCGP